MRDGQAGPAVRSMQARRLEELAAVGGFHPHLESAAVAIDRERHFDPGVAERPHPAEQPGEIVHLCARDPEHDIAGAQIGALGWTAAGDIQAASEIAIAPATPANPCAFLIVSLS